jgi:predicted nuclease with RNAse H fold
MPTPHLPHTNPESFYYRNVAETPEQLPEHAKLDQKWLFIGIDLAPNAALESGLVVLDKDLTLLRMDKLYTNASLITAVEQLGAAHSLIVAIDMPKNLSISGRFRQEEMKYNAMRQEAGPYERTAVDRFSPRGRVLYDAFQKLGMFPVLTYTPNTKANFKLFVPHRARTPQGCRFLQNALSQELRVKNMPVNLAPSSVLDAIVAAYSAWILSSGTLNKHVELYQDRLKYWTVDPLQPLKPKSSSIRPEWVPR